MKTMLEKEAEEFLERNNFKVVKRKFIKNIEELNKTNLKFPWVMKVSSQFIIHKALLGGVVIGIKNIREAKKVFQKFVKFEGFDGVMIQELINGEKFILGLKKTEEFDLVIMVGEGGINVEKIKDVSFRVCPINKEDAYEMISELKCIKRIKKTEIKNFLIRNLILLSEIAEKHPNIFELDINPLIVNNQGIVVDVRIVFN